MSKQKPYGLIEGQPVLIVVDIQGGADAAPDAAELQQPPSRRAVGMVESDEGELCTKMPLIMPRRGKLPAYLGVLPRSAGARREGPSVGDARLALVSPVPTAGLSVRYVRDHLQDFPTAPAERKSAIKTGTGGVSSAVPGGGGTTSGRTW